MAKRKAKKLSPKQKLRALGKTVKQLAREHTRATKAAERASKKYTAANEKFGKLEAKLSGTSAPA